MEAVINLADLEFGTNEEYVNTRLLFAFNLRRLMRERRIQSKDLALSLNVTPPIVTRWRNGDAFPSPENIDKLTKVLGIKPIELLRDDIDPDKPESVEDIDTAISALMMKRQALIEKRLRKRLDTVADKENDD